jgi:enediyne biosynthesis thioesterase
MNQNARCYSYHHIVGFQETNLLGNVYYTNQLAWQGRCRELFLREHAPSIVDDLNQDLRLVTVSCSCEYFQELSAFDEVLVCMRLAELVQNRIRLAFEYWRGPDLVARGEQEIACMRRERDKLAPTIVPPSLLDALVPYGEQPRLRT